MNKQQKTVFCCGYGDSARDLAGRLRQQGWHLIATTRSAEKKTKLEEAGVRAVLFDADMAAQVPDGAHWLISTPPDDDGCPSFRLLKNIAPRAAWIGYLSTTGVYGDLGGGWAFEWSAPNPQNSRSERRVQAEDQWWSVFPDTNTFRLPGIYGPGRSALDRLKAGDTKRIVKVGQVFSRVMVSDIAGCVEAAIHRNVRGQVLHPCDDEPAPPQDVITYAAELLGMELPPENSFEEADLSPMARQFYAECKRVSNARTKSLTGWYPEFPTYREGLRALHMQ